MPHPPVAAGESAWLREIAERAAVEVAPAVVSAFRSPIDVTFKRDDHDVVTEHDRAAEAQITRTILAAVPDSTIVGEEFGERGTGRVRWFVDPIDGTANFARGLAYWCVSIAAAVDDEVVAGVVLDPMAGDLFAADLGGALLNGEPMHSAASPRPDRATIVTSFPSAHDVAILGDGVGTLLSEMVADFQHVRSLGSGALNLAHVAAGRADATMGFDTRVWDVAAGAFILTQAGGTFTGLTGGAVHQPAHLGEDYLAVGAGAEYSSLLATIATLSAGRRVIS